MRLTFKGIKALARSLSENAMLPQYKNLMQDVEEHLEECRKFIGEDALGRQMQEYCNLLAAQANRLMSYGRSPSPANWKAIVRNYNALERRLSSIERLIDALPDPSPYRHLRG